MIRLESVGLHYGKAAQPGPMVLEKISFSIPDGGFRWLRGASGAGKSSLMRLLQLALRPSSGRLTVLDNDIGTIQRRDLPAPPGPPRC